MNLNKDPSSWARVNPNSVCDTDRVIRMAIEDIGKQDAEITRLEEAKRHALALADAKGKENVRLRLALESLTKDPPTTLAREPDTDCEVVLKMRAIARAALDDVQ